MNRQKLKNIGASSIRTALDEAIAARWQPLMEFMATITSDFHGMKDKFSGFNNDVFKTEAWSNYMKVTQPIREKLRQAFERANNSAGV